MIDSHCHLDLPAFDDDLDEVLQRARLAGINGFLIPGTTLSGWQKQRDIAARHADVSIAFGYHPWFLKGDVKAAVSELERAIDTHREEICGVGEIGLDATLSLSLQAQEKWFVAQLQIAQSAGLPVILHHLKTHHRLPALIKQSGFTCGGVVHGFTGNVQIAEQYIALGFYLGVGGTITYPRGKKTLEAVSHIGLSNLLLETDAPDMPLYGRQGRRNEPAHLTEVADTLAMALSVSRHQVATKTSDNFRRLFGGA